MLISESYRRLNARLHHKRRGYGNRGARHLEEVLALINRLKAHTVLDYGCGKGRLARVLSDKTLAFLQNYDPAVSEYSARPGPADLVVCTDVLEHIEPEYLEAVLDDLAALTRTALFVVIATVPDKSKTLPDGSQPHRSLYAQYEWMVKLCARFKVPGSTWDGKEFKAVCYKKESK